MLFIEQGCLCLGGKHRIPDCKRSLVLEAEPGQRDLTLVDPAQQFYASDCDGGQSEVIEAEHGSGSGLNITKILLDEVVQILGRSQLRSLG